MIDNEHIFKQILDKGLKTLSNNEINFQNFNTGCKNANQNVFFLTIEILPISHDQ